MKMAIAAEVVTLAWKEWGLQALVLLSFTLQVTLLILAEFRRRVDSGVLRFFVWSAYLLADAAAIYVLGHMSVTAGRSPEHELVAFWAPFLLLHLGGQDNVTAYAIEDNRLWLRHLQTLAVQVAGAGYILYGFSILSGSRQRSLLWPAAILMFVVGVLKYGERVWALRCAASSPVGNNYRAFGGEDAAVFYHVEPPPATGRRSTEELLLVAHRAVDVPRDFLIGPLPYQFRFNRVHFRRDVETGEMADRYELSLGGEEAYKVAEMQIALMHDILYTKAEVMRTWYGFCIRAFSLPATAVALALFHVHVWSHDKKVMAGYSRVDVAVSYVLLVGAVVLETTSASRAMFSSSTWALLSRRSIWPVGEEGKAWRVLCSVVACCRAEERLWRLLSRLVGALRRLVGATDCCRYWSGSMGQLNVLRLCARSRVSRRSRIASWIGAEDWWNTLAYSWSVPVPARVEQLVREQVLRSGNVGWRSVDHIANSRGRAALKSSGLYEELDWRVDPDGELGLEASILKWHVATDIYLSWYHDVDVQRKVAATATTTAPDNNGRRLAEAAEALSNYMAFLLAARPHMLPAPSSRNEYVHMCYGLTSPIKNSADGLPGLLRRYGCALLDAAQGGSPFKFDYSGTHPQDQSDALECNLPLSRGCILGAKLISMVEEQQRAQGSDHAEAAAENMLKLVAQVWVEMLCYVGHRCSAESHCKQLSQGGELITVAAILLEYLKRDILRADRQ